MITLDQVAKWSRRFLVWKDDMLFVRDNRFRLVDDGDTTKRGVFQLSGITTGAACVCVTLMNILLTSTPGSSFATISRTR